MNTKIIIYDDNCPLCSVYTSAFVKTGLITKDGRQNFNSISPGLMERIDTKRCVNEIPVIDTATNQVWYGIDALLEILQQRIPFIKTIGNIRPVRWFLLKLYKLISYNRRVIVAAEDKTGNFDCIPDFNIPYRLLFMAVFLVLNTVLLIPFHNYVLTDSIFSGNNLLQLQLAHGILVCVNISIALYLKKRNGIEYLGQINMLALIIMLLTVPLVLLNNYMEMHSNSFNSFYLGTLTTFAVLEYRRRMKFIGFTRKHPKIILINAASIVAFIVYLASNSSFII